MRVELDDGEVIALGKTETSPTIGITDYSRRVTDDFGVTTVVERGFARRMSVRIAVPFDQVDALQQRLAALRATPALWIADERFASLSVRGFYKDFALDLAVPPVSYCTLTVEGLLDAEPITDLGGDPAPAGSASTLRLVQPVPVTDARLTASTVQEDDFPAWAAGTAYPLGARVILSSTHRIYESAAGANSGNDPAGSSGKWLDVGPTKRWAMFDQALGTATTGAGAITVTLAAGAVNAVALLDVNASTVRVQAPGYDRTQTVGAGALTFLDMPETSLPVTVTVTGAGLVSVGTLLIGRLVLLGITEANPTAAITDFSRKEVDDFGEVAVVQRAWAKRMSARALIRTDALDQVAGRLAMVRARPALWVGPTGLDSLTIYGFVKDWSIEAGGAVSKLTLSIEGLSSAAQVEPLTTTVDWEDVTDKNGTKPANNADVTSENVAKDTAAVGGRATPEVIAAIDINTTSILEEVLRQDDLLRVIQASAFIEGQPAAVVFLQFRDEQTTATSALASDFSGIFATAPDGTARVIRLDRVLVDEEKTLAARLDEVGLSEADVQAKITEYDEVVSDRFGKVEATRTIAVDINGNVVGQQLVGSEEGPGSLNLINADLRLGTGRVVFNNGSFMRVQGVGFGVASDLLSWFGPTMPLAHCSRANAISYEAVDGDAYFGGTLSAGVLKNGAQTSVEAADASISIGPFDSNGGVRNVVVGYSFTRNVVITNAFDVSGTPTATVRLFRNGGTGWDQISEQTFIGEVTGEDGFGQTEPGHVRDAISGSVTFTDNSGGTSGIMYRAELVARTLATIHSNVSPARPAEVSQRLSVNSVE
jgi:hypothetical protein